MHGRAAWQPPVVSLVGMLPVLSGVFEEDGVAEQSRHLVVKYFSQDSDVRGDPVGDPRRLEERLNMRPRKTLGWPSPAEILAASLAAF